MQNGAGARDRLLEAPVPVDEQLRHAALERASRATPPSDGRCGGPRPGRRGRGARPRSRSGCGRCRRCARRAVRRAHGRCHARPTRIGQPNRSASDTIAWGSCSSAPAPRRNRPRRERRSDASRISTASFVKGDRTGRVVPAAPAGSGLRQQTDRSGEGLPERQVDVHRTGAPGRARRLGDEARRERAPVGAVAFVGHAGVGGIADRLPVQAALRDRLRCADVVHLRWPVGRADDERHSRRVRPPRLRRGARPRRSRSS